MTMNMKRNLSKCPVCGGELEITELRCSKCGTVIRGRFRQCEFCSLEEGQLEFLRLFLASRGNISEVAKRMGVSHPTARQRLNDLLRSLGYEIVEEEEESPVDLLERGEISVEEAIELIKRRKER